MPLFASFFVMALFSPKKYINHLNALHRPSGVILVYIEDSNLALYAERLQNYVVDYIQT